MRGGKVPLRDIKHVYMYVRINPLRRELSAKFILVSYKQLLHVEQVVASRHTRSDYMFCC